jgi:hypothetical protein
MMLTTIEGVYSKGRVKLAEEPKGISEARVLVTFLAEEGRRAPMPLLDAWRARMPEDTDLESLLREIREQCAAATSFRHE